MLWPLLALSVGSVGTVGILSMVVAREAISVMAFDQFETRLAHKARTLETFFLQVEQDVEFIREQPSLRSYPENLDKIRSDFLLFSQGRRAYYQLRFLDMKGQEVIRINLRNGTPELVSENRLQAKGDRYYFRDAISLPPGKIYVSPVDQNMEHGLAENPAQIVVRFASPVFDSSGNRLGIIVINLFANHLLAMISDSPEEGTVALLSADGERLFPFEDGGHPSGGKGGVMTTRPRRTDNGEIIGHASVMVGPSGEERKVYLQMAVRERMVAAATGPVTKLILVILAVVAVGSAAFGVFVSRYLTGPILALRTGTEIISRGDFKHRVTAETGDELEDLALHFNSMAEKLGDSQRKLSDWNESLQDAVTKKSEELRVSEQKERFERRKIEGIVSAIGADLILIEEDGNVSWANRKMIERAGGDRALLGKPCHEVLWSCKDRCNDCLATAVMDDGIPRRKVMSHSGDDGHELFHQVVAAPVEGEDGKISRVLELSIDITDSVLKDREARDRMARADKLAMLGQFSAGIIHEVANPLASMKTTLQVMTSQHEFEPAQVGQVDRVLGEIDRLTAFLRSFSSYAKQAPPDLCDCDVHSLLEQVVRLIRRDALKKEVRVVMKSDSFPGIIYADKGRFQQVILNLVLNSVEAMPKGGTVVIRSGRKENSAWIEIADEGVGISPENYRRIFDPFFTTKPSGTGLGLSIAHDIIRRMNGELTVRPNSGRGTIFRIEVPGGEEEV